MVDGLELTRPRRDGTLIETSVSTAAVLDDLGGIAGIIVITTDITERKRDEAELESRRHADRHLSAIVSASSDAITSSSLDRTLTS